MQVLIDQCFEYLVPYNVPMIRLGNAGDGGYVVPAQILDAQCLISMGLGTNWSFDRDWHDLVPNGHVHAYDGTIDPADFSLSLKTAYHEFFQQQVIHYSENVHAGNINTVLDRTAGSTFAKIDIEGGEYEIVSALGQRQNIIGLVVEFHALDLDDKKQRLKQALSALDQFSIVHVHANNFGGIHKDSLPHTLEISFLRKTLCENASKRYHAYLPGLDSANAQNQEDYILEFTRGCSSEEEQLAFNQ